MKRFSISLPDDVAMELDVCSQRMGYSKSAILGVLIEEPLSDLLAVLGDLPLDWSSAPRRAKGSSLDLLHATMGEIRDEVRAASAHETRRSSANGLRAKLAKLRDAGVI